MLLWVCTLLRQCFSPTLLSILCILLLTSMGAAIRPGIVRARLQACLDLPQGQTPPPHADSDDEAAAVATAAPGAAAETLEGGVDACSLGFCRRCRMYDCITHPGPHVRCTFSHPLALWQQQYIPNNTCVGSASLCLTALGLACMGPSMHLADADSVTSSACVA